MGAIPNDSSKLTNSGKLNTTINPEVLGAFRYKCKQQGVQMNTIIEAFMRQYVDGGFYLKFGRDTGMIDVELDESEKVSSAVTTAPKMPQKGQTVTVSADFGEIVE